MNNPKETKVENATPFQKWFVECVIEGAKNPATPDDFMWDMKNPGEFQHYFDKGYTPTAACALVIGKEIGRRMQRMN